MPMIHRGPPLHLYRISEEFARRVHRAFEYISGHAVIADVEKPDARARVADRGCGLAQAGGIQRTNGRQIDDGDVRSRGHPGAPKFYRRLYRMGQMSLCTFATDKVANRRTARGGPKNGFTARRHAISAGEPS